MSDDDWSLQTIEAIGDVDADEWDQCAFKDGVLDNPFITHAFLLALEHSGSATKDTGWYPQHLILRDGKDTIQGVVPAYVKNHSQGEFVFDHSWADAFHRAGGNYYPKLQLSVPFTPATGPRFLVNDEDKKTSIVKALSQGVETLCEKYNLSSAHATFIDQPTWELLGQNGWLQRTDTQFHWTNNGYENFDDFLEALSSRKRKNIRKERRKVATSGVEFEHVTGAQITETHWNAFFAFYQDTGARKWGTPYLTREFFSLITQTMADNILLIMVKDNGRYIAGALNFIGRDTLFGRYWGAIEELPYLHFETCYYQAMDFAIAHELKYVEAGAQGPHKLARGYNPVTMYSAHHIAHPQFAQAIKKYLAHERTMVAEDNAVLSEQSPFKKVPPRTKGTSQ